MNDRRKLDEYLTAVREIETADRPRRRARWPTSPPAPSGPAGIPDKTAASTSG